jgi:hypothetical protein
MPSSAGRRQTRVLLFALLLSLGSIPAFAQVDFSGEWAPIRAEDHTPNPNVMPGDYVGLPITDEARIRADSWSASDWTLPEWQCRPHPAGYITRGPSNLRIEKQLDPVSRQIQSFNMEWLRSTQAVFYMDGRPHPSVLAPHSWQGFSTGEWVGDTLKVTTTHVKEGYIRRSGVFRSDKASLTQFLTLRGDILTWVIITYDPMVLTEPLIRSTEYRRDVRQQIPAYPCTVVAEIDRPRGIVPFWLPGQNTGVGDYAKYYKIPFEASRGGAEQMYPEYLPKLRQMMAKFRAEQSQQRAENESTSAPQSRQAQAARQPVAAAAGSSTPRR